MFDSEVYEVTVHCKRDAYHCWLTCQVTLRCLIEKILLIVKCVCGHQSARECYLAGVITAGKDPEFVGDFDELRTVYSADFDPLMGLNFSQDQDEARAAITMRSAGESIAIVKLLLRNIYSFLTGCWKLGTQGFVPLFRCIWILSALLGGILILPWIIFAG